MAVLPAPDGTRLSYRVLGQGTPVVCLAGGPMQDSAYLGDLGGLSGRVQVIVLDYRGTGQSETPADAGSYRCDHLVDDIDALRAHLGLDRMNVLAHSAGANVAVLYSAAFPERVGKLALITPSTVAVGITAASELRREMVGLRAGESWFAPASAAFEAIQSGHATDADWEGITPFTYGRWDAAAQAHHASEDEQRNDEAAAVFGSAGAFDPPATRAALSTFRAPVLVLAGEVDVSAPPRVVAQLAGLFPDAALAIQPGAGHFPWLDDAERFTTTVATFLEGPADDHHRR